MTKPIKKSTVSKKTVVRKPMMENGGSLKAVPAGKTGLAKLPTAVRNKMGFKKVGGVNKSKRK